jgi:hypothetical protein
VSSAQPRFHEVLTRLADVGVEVVVGMTAAVVPGVPATTQDLDVVSAVGRVCSSRVLFGARRVFPVDASGGETMMHGVVTGRVPNRYDALRQCRRRSAASPASAAGGRENGRHSPIMQRRGDAIFVQRGGGLTAMDVC